MIHNDLHDAWIGYVHQKKQLIRKSSKSRRFRSGSEIYLSVFDQRSIGASCWTKLWLKYVCRIRYANINAIIYGHNITIIYPRTSIVVYVQNMTCAPIRNKMIFDWKHQGGQGGAKNTTKEHFYGHDTAQTYNISYNDHVCGTSCWTRSENITQNLSPMSFILPVWPEPFLNQHPKVLWLCPPDWG